MIGLPMQPRWQVSTRQRTHARKLRRDLTDAERVVRNAVRARQLGNAYVRPQAPIGPFIGDLACHDACLIVDIDGGQHFQPEHINSDIRRESVVKSKGYRDLRCNNHDVLSNRAGETIQAAVTATLSPTLSRKREKEHTEPGLVDCAPCNNELQ